MPRQRKRSTQPTRKLDYVRQHVRALSQMRILGRANQVLLKLIAAVGPNARSIEDSEAPIRAIISTFLDSAVMVFGDKRCRGAVLWPVDNGKYLAFWGEANMPAHGDWRFEIGNPEREGVAGYSFRTQTIAHGVLSKDSDGWHCTNPHYCFIDDSKHEPRYRSFVCVPLVGPDSDTLGVLCFDSPRINIFLLPEVEPLIIEIADSLAAALAAYQNYAKLQARVAALEASKAIHKKSNQDTRSRAGDSL